MRMLPGWLNAARAIVAAPRTQPMAMKSDTPNLLALPRLCLLAVNRCMTFLPGLQLGSPSTNESMVASVKHAPRQTIICQTNAEPGSSRGCAVRTFRNFTEQERQFVYVYLPEATVLPLARKRPA